MPRWPVFHFNSESCQWIHVLTIQKYDTSEMGMSGFHHGRFDVPRGKLVPRDDDADDDGLAILEGPEAVLLGALVWLPVDELEVEATEDKFTTLV
jgi:hypothetical protein